MLKDIDLLGSGRAVLRQSWPQRLRQVSTLLRLLAGLDQPSRGELLAGSAALAEVREDTRLMFQDSRLLPWKRVIDNVGLGLRGDWRAKALQALRAVGLAERPTSGRRPCPAGRSSASRWLRALIHEPRLLLLDEPLGALDALTRIEMQQLIEGTLARTRFHRPAGHPPTSSEAVAVADRVILIEDGEIGLTCRGIAPAALARLGATGRAGSRSAQPGAGAAGASRRNLEPVSPLLHATALSL
ncbi:ATP-binding cassette domain-containing protein [Pseudomonas aeruginosa]